MIGAAVELITVLLERCGVADRGLGGLAKIREFPGAEAEKLKKALVAVVVVFVVQHPTFEALRQVLKMNEGSHPEVVAEQDEHGEALV